MNTEGNTPVIILIGPPGCGKGTQGDRIAQTLKLPKISTGDLLRNEIKLNTPLGKQVSSIMEAGKLVDDETVLSVLKQKIQGNDCANGFILDGFPRSLPQATGLDKTLAKLSKQFQIIAIHIDVSDDAVVERISNRYFCTQCKTNYNKLYKNPKIENVCDVCGGKEFAVRPDDKVEVITSRLQTYHQQTKLLLAYYDSRNMLSNIDGNADAEIVFDNIIELLNNLLTS